MLGNDLVPRGKNSYRFRTAVQPNHMQLFAAFLEFEYEILNCGFRKLFENHMTIIWFRAQVQQSLTPFYKTSFASSIKECFCLSRSWNVTPHLAGSRDSLCSALPKCDPQPQGVVKIHPSREFQPFLPLL